MSRSGLTLYQDELLEILAEEAAEIVQEKSKIFRFGMSAYSWHDTTKTHTQCLEQELGDIVALIDLIVEANIGVTAEGIAAASARKKEKVPKWMSHTKPASTIAASSPPLIVDSVLESNITRFENYRDGDK